MKVVVILAMLGLVALSEAIPAVPLEASELLPQPTIRVARAPVAEAKPADKDLEGSETAYGAYPYYYHYPYYSYYRYPYYIYGK